MSVNTEINVVCGLLVVVFNKLRNIRCNNLFIRVYQINYGRNL